MADGFATIIVKKCIFLMKVSSLDPIYIGWCLQNGQIFFFFGSPAFNKINAAKLSPLFHCFFLKTSPLFFQTTKLSVRFRLLVLLSFLSFINGESLCYNHRYIAFLVRLPSNLHSIKNVFMSKIDASKS